ncbi:hypothetical protein MBLNU230_g1339t1 [Neophaeotheca triangularis]
MQSGAPPEDPQYTSEHTPLSPASPKPLHFQQPSNIPILENQMDIAFNQTEVHMSDPSMHNTEVRPDAWKEGGEKATQESNNEGEADKANQPAQQPETSQRENITSKEPAPDQGVKQANGAAYEANIQLNTEPATGEPLGHATQPNVDPATSSGMSQPDQSDIPAQSTEVPPEQPQEAAAAASSAPIDFQALLASLNHAPSDTVPMSNTAPGLENSEAQPPAASGISSPVTASGLGPAPGAGLPSRPPPQEQPLIHPNYVHSQHIRDYHPHAAHPAFQPQSRTNGAGNAVDPSSRQFIPAVASQPVQNGQAHPVTHPQASPDTTPAQQAAQHSRTSSGTPLESRRERNLTQGEPIREEDMKWTQETQRKFDQFIVEERAYVAEGRWEQFPPGSRLFVGNLSSERVTKRDIFHVFHHYGALAQISIKQAYGFVQYLRKEDCQRALDVEQGRQIRDKRIHLEISKPQKNRVGAVNPPTRRSRSPDANRRAPPTNGVDRFGRNGPDVSGRASRDGYRGGYRSPSPPPRSYRDRYDDRYRSRSRSPGYRRYRSPSPRRRGASPGDDLPLPRRAPHNVPAVQILVIEALSRDFIQWVEEQFNSRGLRAESLIMSPRLDEAAVVRRQIIEGVQAVCKLVRRNQDTGRLDLRLFDRRGGTGNVSFEEYNAIEPHICVELVKRAKQQAAAAMPPQPPQQYGQYPQYGLPSTAPPQPYSYNPTPQQQAQPYGHPPPPQLPQGYPPGYPQQQPPPPQAQTQSLQQVLGNLDPSNLQNLLAAMSGQQQSTPGQAHSAQYPPQQPYGQYAGPPPGQQDPLAALRANPALAGMLQQQQQQQQLPSAPQTPSIPPQAPPRQQPPGGQVNMAEILARLGSTR